jgi:Ca2+-transporting ATPase
MLFGPFVGLVAPLLAAQILWINLLTHGLPGVAIGAEAAEPDVAHRPPRPPQEGVLTRRTTVEVLLLGTLMAVSCLGLAWWAHAGGRPWQTMLFLTLCLAQLGIALVIRSDQLPVWRVPVAANRLLVLAVALSALLVLGGIYLPGLRTLLGTQPLSLADLGIAAAVATLPALALELGKAGQRAHTRRTGPDQPDAARKSPRSRHKASGAGAGNAASVMGHDDVGHHVMRRTQC